MQRLIIPDKEFPDWPSAKVVSTDFNTSVYVVFFASTGSNLHDQFTSRLFMASGYISSLLTLSQPFLAIMWIKGCTCLICQQEKLDFTVDSESGVVGGGIHLDAGACSVKRKKHRLSCASMCVLYIHAAPVYVYEWDSKEVLWVYQWSAGLPCCQICSEPSSQSMVMFHLDSSVLCNRLTAQRVCAASLCLSHFPPLLSMFT